MTTPTRWLVACDLATATVACGDPDANRPSDSLATTVFNAASTVLETTLPETTAPSTIEPTAPESTTTAATGAGEVPPTTLAPAVVDALDPGPLSLRHDPSVVAVGTGNVDSSHCCPSITRTSPQVVDRHGREVPAARRFRRSTND